jgi:secreted trypsin-like serine protease
MASLNKTKPEGWRHACGAAALTGWYVVTAAHCVTTEAGVVLDPAGMRVRTGTVTWAQGGQVVDVTAIHVYPRWDRELRPPRAHADLALLRLADEAGSEPFPLASHLGESVATRMLGWGAKPDNDTAVLADGKAPPADVLHEFDAVSAARSACTTIKITDAEICVEHPDGVVPCHGDSGGPVLQRVDGRWFVVGVISHAYDPSGDSRCARVASLTASTDLTDPAYQSWIRQIVCTPTLTDAAPCQHWNPSSPKTRRD